MAKNGENDEFFVMPIKHGSVLIGLVNCPGTLKPWSIGHEKTKNCVKDMVLDMPLNNGSGLITLVNWIGILKLWAIAHENSQKSRKWRVFYHASRTWIGSYTACKSPQNPKTMVNRS